MRDFNYTKIPDELYRPEIVKMLTTIYEFRGKQANVLRSAEYTLTPHIIDARRERLLYFSKSVGYELSEERIREIVDGADTPKNAQECDIAGYNEAIIVSNEKYVLLNSRSSTILYLHKNLMKYRPLLAGGIYKTKENDSPVLPSETSEYISKAAAEFIKACEDDNLEPLLYISMFLLDIMLIKPFDTGNERIFSLITTILLCRSNFHSGRFCSFDKLYYETRHDLQSILESCEVEWMKNSSYSYLPFVNYFLKTTILSYKDFFGRALRRKIPDRPPLEKITNLFDKKSEWMAKRDVMAYLPDISLSRTELALTQLCKSGYIEKCGNGKNIKYRKNYN